MTLELLLLKIQKKRSVIERRKIPITVLKDALTSYLQPLGYSGKEIIDIDIPQITTAEVDIKIYWR